MLTWFQSEFSNFDTLVFVLSAELGDYDEVEHTPAFVSEFRFVQNQNEEFEIQVLDAFKKLK